jgi:peptidoglycan/xylan/chitin deacetylase (PgdA/CDA1 family)
MNNSKLEKTYPKKIVLTFDDAVKNHYTFVAPILKKYHFGATFFPCAFSEDWRKKNQDYSLSKDELTALYNLGFEIGNHTWNHPGMSKLTDEENLKEIELLNKYLSTLNIPKPTSFAYPGGPYVPNVVPLLISQEINCARTTELRPWIPSIDDNYRIPAIPISKNDKEGFYNAVKLCNKDNYVVLVFHGIPDIVHPWVTNNEETFLEFMKYLYNNDYQVVSLKTALSQQ